MSTLATPSSQDRTIETTESATTITPSQIRWLEARMQTAFANVVNVQSTREQVDIFFGTNQTWSPEGGEAVTVDLSNRIMLTPFAAKRLATVLAAVLGEYESRYGAIPIAS